MRPCAFSHSSRARSRAKGSVTTKPSSFLARLAFNASKIGKNVFIVIEQLSEIDTLLKLAKAEGFSPNIGLRVKLNVSGEGKWADSVGENAKFGLFPTDIISALGKLKRAGLRDKVKLVHFHVGSQVPNIATIKSAVNEATRFYCELRRMGFPVDYIDCGGGLAIDYDGSRSISSANNSSLLLKCQKTAPLVRWIRRAMSLNVVSA